jgi:hypothetical protein
MDFSILTNDQLLELIRAAVTEAAARGTAVTAAASGILIDAQEAARIERDAIGKLDAAAEMAERVRLFRATVKSTPVIPVLTQAEANKIAAAGAEKAEREGQIEAREEAARQSKVRAEQDKAGAAKAEQDRLWTKKAALARDILAAMPTEYRLRLQLWKHRTSNERRVYIQNSTESLKVCYYADGCDKHAPGSMETKGCAAFDKAAIKAACQRCIKDWNSVSFDVDEAAAYGQETVNA